MPSTGGYPGETVANGTIVGDESHVTAQSKHGFSGTIVRNGVGSYTITLANPCDKANRSVACAATALGNIAVADEVAGGSDSEVHFLLSTHAGVAAEGGITFTVTRCEN